MSIEKLQDAIGMVDDELVKEADKLPNKGKRFSGWPYVAVAAVLAIIATVGIVMWQDDGNKPEEPTRVVQNETEESTTEKDTTLVVENNNSTTEESTSHDILSELPSEEETTEEPTLVQGEHNVDLSTFAIATCGYPKMSSYPNEFAETFMEDYAIWRDERAARHQAYEDGNVDINEFITNSVQTFLCGSEGENRVYSPLNVYMALAMLAEVTDGNSRQQILDVLGSDSIESLRTEANALWKGHYSDDGAVKSVLASSLWLNKDINFNEDTLKYLSENYYASSYSGEMGSDEFNEALQTWLNEQTGGMLEGQLDEMEMKPETILSLATTIYYRATWDIKFSEQNNNEGIFYGADGQSKCQFMNQSFARTYYWGEKFSAVEQGLEESGGMWLILPDEGVTVDELLADEEAMSFIFAGEQWENNKHLIVNFSVPKFDVSSQINLMDGLKELGVTDVFDYMVSDFTPMTTDTEDIFVSSASHGARVTIDEEGCAATGFTAIMTAGSAMPPDEQVDFVLDRPFVFVITSDVGMPLFVGVVNSMN